MFTRLTKRVRCLAALLIAIVYAVCVLTPAVAQTLADGRAAHCLTDNHHGGTNPVPAAHDQAQLEGGGATVVTSAVDADAPDHARPAGSCCGLFCVPALPAAEYAVFSGAFGPVCLQKNVQDSLDGRGPDRITRPPIAFLSL